MRLRLRSCRVPRPRRITLLWKLAALLMFIAVLLVALTMVSLASLAKVSDGGRRNFTQVTQPLAALGSARALINENAGLADRHILEDTLETKRPLEQRILANDRRIAHALAAAAPTFTTAQERKSARFLQRGRLGRRADVGLDRGFLRQHPADQRGGATDLRRRTGALGPRRGARGARRSLHALLVSRRRFAANCSSREGSERRSWRERLSGALPLVDGASVELLSREARKSTLGSRGDRDRERRA